LSVGGSVRYMVRNLRCTVTIDSVLANSKTQNAFLFTVHAIFRQGYLLAVEPASTPRPLVQKKLWEILYLLICSFLPLMSWLLRSRVRKFRRDLWITLYNIPSKRDPHNNTLKTTNWEYANMKDDIIPWHKHSRVLRDVRSIRGDKIGVTKNMK